MVAGHLAYPNSSLPLLPFLRRSIPDLSEEVLNCENDVQLGKEMANKLCEPKTELMIGVLDLVGREVALELFRRTQERADGTQRRWQEKPS